MANDQGGSTGTGFTASRPRFQPQHLKTVLVANRGEIALRLLLTSKALGLRTIAIYTTADEGAPHTLAADVAVHLPGKEAESQGYLHKEAIVSACRQHDVQAVLPGYGFLSENEDFASQLETAGIVLCGPRAETMEAFGLKHRARELAEKAGVPCVPGTGLLPTVNDAIQQANSYVGYPCMLKSSAGGGGMGLQVCHNEDELRSGYDTVTSRGQALFGSADVFLERYIESGRHIEVQIFGNGCGDCISFNERECSIQRRNQKVIEEAPSPFVAKTPGLRQKLTSAAVSLGRMVSYKSAGTVEMLVDDANASFYFLECNVRLQVEHPVTEAAHDVDLVALMLLQAEHEVEAAINRAGDRAGIPSPLLQSLQSEPQGWAIEARLYAEDPIRSYAPSPGLLQCVEFPPLTNTRVDGWIRTGTSVTPNYDPLLAKLVGIGSTREKARSSLSSLLSQSKVQGPPTNLELLQQIIDAQPFRTGHTLTSFLTNQQAFVYQPLALEVLSPGLATSVQAWPGRRGVLKGVPEAGPLDPFSMRIANRLVGNDDRTEGLEFTMTGPEMLFHSPAIVALVGAEMQLTLDGSSAPTWTQLSIKAGSKLAVGRIKEGTPGARSYLAIRGGLPNVAVWLGSKATSPAIGVGGFQGRNLLPGDTLAIARCDLSRDGSDRLVAIPPEKRWTRQSRAPREWHLYAVPGPFDDDVFLTAEDRNKLYKTPWKVSAQAARSGNRFDAPQLDWARKDGGEGGSHPSNLLEFGYGRGGGINWNGNTPVLLGADGPDLGGLLISHTVVSSDWRAGQLAPGDSVRFDAIDFGQARQLLDAIETYLSQLSAYVADGQIEHLQPVAFDVKAADVPPSSLLTTIQPTADRPLVEFRACGDRAIMLCYGEHTANILNRVRIELLQRQLKDTPGIVAFSPNVRTLTILFDPLKTSPDVLIERITAIENTLPKASETKLPVRSWKLPVTLDDPKVADAVQRYRQTIRNKAIYLEGDGDNKPYIARANAISIEDVAKAVVDTTYTAVAVGFYFATPILQPLDPRKRLRCQKYNPTRLFTPRGALGLGGSMLAIYGADSPGGYPLIARTIPGWNTFGTTAPFTPDQPWLLSDFDFVRFVPVDQGEYDRILASFDAGTYKFDVTETIFDASEQDRFLEGVRDEAKAFEANQSEALNHCQQREDQMYEEWKAEQDSNAAAGGGSGAAGSSEEWEQDPQAIVLRASLAGSVWKVVVKEGEEVGANSLAVVLEAMKSEVNVRSEVKMRVEAVFKSPGTQVMPGDALVAGRRL
ncbi:unnamed protein product [Jaminaea pallidilutea]